MYFSNINDPELQEFHGITAPNFTIKLSDILHKTGGTFDNKLFKIEEIITDKIYKIYPMFNTNNITSSNPNDQILDNKLIIAEKKTTETRITFISNNNTDIEDYIQYGTYYQIGNNLTTAQFNSIVQLLRNNHQMTDKITVKNGTVTGDYGKYTFDITSTTIVDNGILITAETLTSLGTVKLTDPTFANSTYTLHLTIYSYDNPNILEDETTSDITITTLDIELIEGTAVNIPFDTLTYSNIISFDASVTIAHNKPEIRGAYVTGLTLTTSKDTLEIGDTTTLTMKATDLDTLPVTNKTIKLYKNGTLINSYTTDNNGECTYTYTAIGDGKDTFTAKHAGTLTTDQTVTDCKFYKNTTEWFNQANRITPVQNADGSTTLTNSSGSNGFYLANEIGTPKTNYTDVTDWPLGTIIEFDVISTDPENYIQLNDYVNNISSTIQFSTLGVTTDNHIKITVANDGTVTYQVDNETPVTATSQTSKFAIGFRVNNGKTITFDNFMIYPI